MQERKSTFADFGPRLAQQIKLRLGSEADAARKTGITPQAINTYVRENRLPKAEQLHALAEAMGVTMEFLLTGKQSTEWAVNEPLPQSSSPEARKLIRQLLSTAKALETELEKY
jgi:transcriptional regulator with XRE-family HTH domain